MLLAATILIRAQVQTSDDSNTEKTIHGVVLNSVTHEPIARALVFSTDQRFAMLTDHEGRFEFKVPASGGNAQSPGTSAIGASAGRVGPPPGFLLLARKPGFMEDRANLSAQRLLVAAPDSDYKIELVPEGLITGHIVAASEPPAGVVVQLIAKQIQDGKARWVSRFTSITNSSGDFRFADLIPGSYKLMTQEFVDPSVNSDPEGPRFGYPPIYYPGATDFTSSGNLRLEAGQSIQTDLTLTRQPYYPVKIPVAGIDRGMPVNVTVRNGGGGPSGYSLGYGSAQVVSGSLPNGTYEVLVNSFGATPASGSVRITIAGAPFTGPPIVLTHFPSIPVSVREEFTGTDNQSGGGGGGPVRGGGGFNRNSNQPRINLYLQSDDETPGRGLVGLRPQRGSDDESLALENVPPGRYRVVVNSPRGYASAITSGVSDLLREPLIVGEGGAAAPIEVTLRDDFATVEGEVVDPAAPPGASVQPNSSATTYAPTSYVNFFPLPDSPGQYALAPNTRGSGFRFPRLTPGSYRVIATEAPEQLEYRDPDVMRAYENSGPSITVVGGQSIRIQVPLIQSDESAKNRQDAQ